MATVTGAAGDWPWRPDPALVEALRKLAAQQRAMAPWLDAIAAQRRQWAEVMRQSDAFRETIRRASETARAFSALQPQLEVWPEQQDQIAQTIRLMQARPSLRMGFSAPTLDQASELLEQVRSALPEAPAGTEAAVPEIPDAVIQEAVEAAESAVSDVDSAVARRLVITVIATLVFLKVIQWSIEHPEATGEILNTGTLAYLVASAAANQAGRLWDTIFGTRSTHPDVDPDSDD
jgi:hypothetical protein